MPAVSATTEETTTGLVSSSSGVASTTGLSSTSSGAEDDTSATTLQPPLFDIGIGDTTNGSDCIPTTATETVCDGLDDDCNGLIDDIDIGQDGICDCLSIAIVGEPGGNESSAFQQWLLEQGTSTVRIDPPAIDATVLGAYDVILLDRMTRDYGPAEAAAFDAWVDGGGGLMALTGHTADPIIAQQWPNSILSIFNIEYQGILLDGPITDFAPHPITVGQTVVTFLGGFEVVETMPGTSEVVGRLASGTPVVRVQEHGTGKLVVWGDEWIEYDSEWSTQPEITELWTNILAWLTPANICLLPQG